MPLREKAETADKLNSDLNSVKEEMSKRSKEIQVGDARPITQRAAIIIKVYFDIDLVHLNREH